MAATVPKYYMHPPAESHDAYKIWNDCCLPPIAEQTQIYWALDTWARLNAIIEYREQGPYLTWYSPSGTRHTAYADVFAHWLLCACRDPPPLPTITVPEAEEPVPEQPDTPIPNGPSPGTENKLELFAIKEEEPTALLQADLEVFLNGDTVNGNS